MNDKPTDRPTPEQEPSAQPSTVKPAKPRRRSAAARILRTIAIVAVALLLIIIAVIGTAVWILTPERLTPLVNRVATEQLDATVEARRVELTFWSSFPRLRLQIDSLTVVSHSLRSLDEAARRRLPQGADSLMSLGQLRGGVDVLSLLAAKIRLYDVELRRPKVNIVQVDSVHSNYDIFPRTEPQKSPEPLKVPDITVNRFAILDGFPIRFTSIADSLTVDAMLSTGVIEGKDSPVYTLQVAGNGGSRAGTFELPPLPFSLDGELQWKAAEPGQLRARALTLSADKVALTFDAALQMLDTLALNELKVTGREIAIADIIHLIPEKMRGELAKIHTDLRASFTARLLDPYIPSSGVLPRFDMELSVPRGSLNYGPLDLSSLQCEVSGTVNPRDIDLTELRIKEFAAKGNAIDFTLDATVRNPVSDPLIEGTFEGSVDFSRLPASLTDRLPATVRGVLEGKADFNLRQSHLSPKGFHRMRINGDLRLRNFHAAMKDGSATLYTRDARFRLGTSNSVKVNGVSVDSLLTASLDIDTIAASIPGVTFSGQGITMGLGSRNVASSFDTTRINPLGATIRAHRLALRTDSDSISAFLTDSRVKATLQRYNNDARSPLLKLGLEMGRLRMADRYNRFSLRDATAELTLHPKGRPRMSRRMQQTYDSVAALHPGLASDSIMSLARRSLRRSRAAATAQREADRSERIDFAIDNSLRSWLRLWQVEGSIKASTARVFTPYFPVRNRVTDLDITFSTDSVAIRDTRYRMGGSDFLINGTVSNISRALTSRRGAPIRVDLDISSDTLNLNDITRALMMGSAFSEKLSRGEAHISSSGSDADIERSIDSQIDSTDRGPILIPTNVTANINMRAGTLKYGDILFQRFTGQIEAQDGAVHLKRLGAFTPMGSFGVTALYSAPNPDDIKFAGGIVIRRLDLREFLNMLPEIDTIIPMLHSMEGIITAECAMSSDLDSMMNLKFHTLDMALKLSGDSLVLLDSETFRTISKWLMFKNKKRNMIDSMSVEMVIRDSRLMLYPFMVTLDRYRFGISGSNDAALNLDYHIAVLKSPIPFKFGVNIKGTPDNLKIRLGGAHFNENKVASSRNLTDTVRINLVREIQNFFRFGVRNSRNRKLTLTEPKVTPQEFTVGDTLTASDSLFFIREGIIPKPKGWVDPDCIAPVPPKKKKKFLGIF